MTKHGRRLQRIKRRVWKRRGVKYTKSGRARVASLASPVMRLSMSFMQQGQSTPIAYEREMAIEYVVIRTTGLGRCLDLARVNWRNLVAIVRMVYGFSQRWHQGSLQREAQQ